MWVSVDGTLRAGMLLVNLSVVIFTNYEMYGYSCSLVVFATILYFLSKTCLIMVVH